MSPGRAEPACMTAALCYSERGWRVLPLQGKVPLLPGWHRPDGTGAATTDADTIRSWWARWPRANVGIACGPASDLAVLDVDPRNGGTESLSALEERVGVLPGTVVNLTGGSSSGFHLLYRYSDRKVVSRANAHGVGLDIKGHGGQIVAPPSVHPDTGRRYAWLGGCWRDELPVWPEALLPPVEQVRPTVGQGAVGVGHAERRLVAVVQFVLDSQPGDRNGRLFWAACRGCELIAAGDDRNTVVGVLQLAGEAVGLPPAEARATIRSGMRTTAVAA